MQDIMNPGKKSQSNRKKRIPGLSNSSSGKFLQRTALESFQLLEKASIYECVNRVSSGIPSIKGILVNGNVVFQTPMPPTKKEQLTAVKCLEAVCVAFTTELESIRQEKSVALEEIFSK